MKLFDIFKSKPETGQWIEDDKLPRTTADFKTVGCTIGECVPPKYESYCKIFHPFEVTPDEEEILEPQNEYGQKVNLVFNKDNESGIAFSEIKEDGTVVDILERFKERKKEYNSKRWSIVSWKNIAEKYGLIFHNQINPDSFVAKFLKIGWQRNLNFPREGYLPRQSLIKLLDILKTTTKVTEVCIYQMPPNNIWKDNKDSDFVKCSYEGVLEYFDKDFIGYLYAIDKSWIILTDTDLTFTIVGGRKKLIYALVASDLEVLECKSTTRVDNYSDELNERKLDIR